MRQCAKLGIDARARRVRGADRDAGSSGAGDNGVRLVPVHGEADDGTRRAAEVANGDAGKGGKAAAKAAGKQAAALFDRGDADLEGVVDSRAQAKPGCVIVLPSLEAARIVPQLIGVPGTQGAAKWSIIGGSSRCSMARRT
jgi:hypothetical protein